jgi:hypothetical protein
VSETGDGDELYVFALVDCDAFFGFGWGVSRGKEAREREGV